MKKALKAPDAVPDVARLTAHGLNVADVTRNDAGGLRITWNTHPTEAEQAFAAELLGEPVDHAT